MPTTTTDTSTAVEALVRKLYGLGRVRREIAGHALDELGSQGFTSLAIIHMHGPLRVSEVARRLSVDLSVASRQIAALAAAGYVHRERDPEDGRAQIVSTTEPGHAVLAECHRRMVEAFGKVLEGWTAEEIATVTDGLGRLITDFEELNP